jgi:microcystin-dependent protein
MAENFDLIFGQNASQQYAWNDTDYQNGWETIGNIPPTAAQFDALQRRSDTKMKELNDELTPLVNADTTDSRQPSTAYNVDDIKYSPLLPTGWYLLCTTGGTTSASDLVITSPAVGNTVTDGGVVWTIDKIGKGSKSGGGTPTGTIIAYASNGALPDGYLSCDGSAVSRTTYADLFTAIGTTWGSGNGSTTFSLPNLNGYWAKGSSTAGSSVSAGLPNIMGSTGDNILNSRTTNDGFFNSGALSCINKSTDININGSAGPTGVAYYTLSFNATNSNSLYGASTTVSVSSKTVRYIIKY